jgi:hypothetical protein
MIQSTSISNLETNNGEIRNLQEVGAAPSHDLGDQSRTMSPSVDNPVAPASFPTLWLPFKSPFKRPFFSSNGKELSYSNQNQLVETHEVCENPMTAEVPSHQSKGSIEASGGILLPEKHHNASWSLQNSFQNEKNRESISMTRLDNDNIPMASCNMHATKQDLSAKSTGDGFNLNFSGNSQPEQSSASQGAPIAIRSQKMSSDSEPMKQRGYIPTIRLTRRGRSDKNRDQRDKQTTEPLRVTHKKQRAAHQASSPPSQASVDCFTSFNRHNNKRDASPPPTPRYINGHKVTMIDDNLKVFVVDLLTPETCDLVRRMTDDHVKQVKESGNNVVTWRTLYTYTKRDLPCCEVKGLTSCVTDHIMTNIIDIVGEIFGNKKEAAKLHPRSWKEPHLLLYQKFKNQVPHTGVEMHYDGCDITYNCMLSKSTEYGGGGTYIRALRKTVRLEQGQVLVHSGELYHKGCDITEGERALIVCFMDGFDLQIVDPSTAQEDKASFEKNVRMYG